MKFKLRYFYTGPLEKQEFSPQKQIKGIPVFRRKTRNTRSVSFKKRTDFDIKCPKCQPAVKPAFLEKKDIKDLKKILMYDHSWKQLRA